MNCPLDIAASVHRCLRLAHSHGRAGNAEETLLSKVLPDGSAALVHNLGNVQVINFDAVMKHRKRQRSPKHTRWRGAVRSLGLCEDLQPRAMR